MSYRGFAIWAILLATLASSNAAWSGYPFNENAPTLYELEQYDFAGQIYSAIVERCEAFGVSPPSIVETWTVPDQVISTTSVGYVAFGFSPEYFNGFYYSPDDDGVNYAKAGDLGVHAYGYTIDVRTYMELTIQAGGTNATILGDVDGWKDGWEDVPLDGTTGVGSPTFYGLGPAGGIYPYTNTWNATTTMDITTTNAIGPIEYTNSAGSNLTYNTPITSYFLSQLDAKIAELAPLSVSTNEAVGGRYDDWFAHAKHYTWDGTNVTATNLLTSLPMNSMAGLGKRMGIGYATDLTGYSFSNTTNAIDFVTGGTFWFDEKPQEVTRQDVPLYETWYDTFGQFGALQWRNKKYDPFVDIAYSSFIQYRRRILPSATNFPVITYYSIAETNTASLGNIVISGISIGENYSYTDRTATETVNLSGAMVQSNTNESLWEYTQALTSRWIRVNSITSPAANTGDVLVVKWAEDTPMYVGNSEIPWWPYTQYVNNWIHIYAKNVDDRVDLLNAMVWSSEASQIVNPYSSSYANYPGVVATTSKVSAAISIESTYKSGEEIGTTHITRGDFWWDDNLHLGRIGDSLQTSIEPTFTQMANITDPNTGYITTWNYYGSNHVELARINQATGDWAYRYAGTIHVAITDFGGNTNRTATFSYSRSGSLAYPDGSISLNYDTPSHTFTNINLIIFARDDNFLTLQRTGSSGLGISVTYDFDYKGAAAYCIRISNPLAFVGLSTNLSKTVDAYLLGGYPTVGANLSYEPWRSNTDKYWRSWVLSDLLGTLRGRVSLNQLFPEYKANGPPPFTWKVPSDIPVLENLTPTNYVYIETQDLGLSSYYVFDAAMTTNSIANGNPTDADVSSGWAIRGGLNVIKWDFQYK